MLSLRWIRLRIAIFFLEASGRVIDETKPPLDNEMIASRALRFYQFYGKRTTVTRSIAANGNNNGAADRIVKSRAQVVQSILSNTEITRDHMTPEIKLFLLTTNCSLYHAPMRDWSEENQSKGNVFEDPFWSIYWPGGQALTRFIFDEREKLFPSSRRNKISVLDVGAGCGASAIAAKIVGADRVIANDIDEGKRMHGEEPSALRLDSLERVAAGLTGGNTGLMERRARIDVTRARTCTVACIAISMNAALNNVDIEVSQENLLHLPAKKLADFIFVGDLLYDELIAEQLIPWMENAVYVGTRVLLGDPGRHGLTINLKSCLKPLKRYSLPENVRKENHGYDECTVWEYCGL